jgi:hypothetical protein
LFDSLAFACFELVPVYFAKPYAHHGRRYNGEMARCQRFDPVAITGKFSAEEAETLPHQDPEN